MPIIKSAIKKLRADIKKTKSNRPVLSKLRTAVKAAKKDPSESTISHAYSAVDRATKRGLVKRNTAARIKAGGVRASKGKVDKSPFAKK